MPDWLTDWLTDWQTSWFSDWFTDWQTDWQTYWLTDWLINWLTVWLVVINWVLRYWITILFFSFLFLVLWYWSQHYFCWVADPPVRLKLPHVQVHDPQHQPLPKQSKSKQRIIGTFIQTLRLYVLFKQLQLHWTGINVPCW